MAVSPYANEFGYLGFAPETVAGTAVAPTRFMKLSAMGGGETQDVKTFNDGVNYDTTVNLKAGEWNDTTASGYLTPDTSTALLSYILAATDGVTGAGDPYTHAGGAAQVYPRLLSFEQCYGNQTQIINRTADCFLKEWKLSAKAGEWGKVDIGYMGGITTFQTTPATVVFDADRELTFIDATLTITGLTVAITDVTDFMLDIKSNVIKTQVIGSATPKMTTGVRTISLDLSCLMPNNSVYREVFFGSSSGTAAAATPKVLTVFTANFAVGGSPAHSFSITANNVAMQAAKPAFDVSGKPLVVALSGMAQFKGGTAAITYSSANATSAAY